MFMLLQKFSISKTNDIIIFTYFIHILQIVITNVALGNFYTRMSDENFSSEVRVLAARLIVSKKKQNEKHADTTCQGLAYFWAIPGSYIASKHGHFLRCSKILGAVHQSRLGDLKVEEICYKESACSFSWWLMAGADLF
jgi:hypothetical protein